MLLLNRDWPARVLRQQRLTLLEWRRRGGWSGFRNYSPVCHGGSRPWCNGSPGGVAHHTRHLWSYTRRGRHSGNDVDLIRPNVHRNLLYWTSAGERVLRDRDHCASHVAVCVIGRWNASGADIGVINVGDLDVVDYCGVAGVDLCNIGRTGAIGGEVYIARAEREPADTGAAESDR